MIRKPSAAVETRWQIVLDGFTPPSVNRLLTSHWAIGHRLKNAVKDRIACGRMMCGPIPDATGRRRVSVAVTVAGRGGMVDPDNTLKSLLDALVANRLIVDDSARWIEIGSVTVERGVVKRTVVTLEDVA